MGLSSSATLHCAFTIPGRITGKGRPRFNRKTGTAYTPSKTRSEEAMIGTYASLAMRGKPILTGPVSLSVAIWLNTPKSWAKAKVASAYYATGPGDIDNACKEIADSLNGIVWKDDAQISDLRVVRRYCNDRKECVEVKVFSLEASIP